MKKLVIIIALLLLSSCSSRQTFDDLSLKTPINWELIKENNKVSYYKEDEEMLIINKIDDSYDIRIALYACQMYENQYDLEINGQLYTFFLSPSDNTINAVTLLEENDERCLYHFKFNKDLQDKEIEKIINSIKIK